MIDLRDSTVLVNNVEEYIAVTKIAKKQGFRWVSGAPLNKVLCEFPINGECKVYYNSSAYYYNRDYKCKEIVGALRNMILKRKEGQLC